MALNNHILNKHKRAVGVFSNIRSAEYALTELRDAGFPMKNVSVIAKDTERTGEVAGVETHKGFGNKADEGAAAGAVTGTILGGMTGLVVGLGSLAFPGVGAVILAGEIITTIAAATAGAGIGAAAGGFLGALLGLGIPEEQAQVYNERVTRGDYLVIIDGTEAEICHAENILRNRGVEEFGIYNAPHTADTSKDEPPVTIVDNRNASI